MNNRELKFRVWNNKTKAWVHKPSEEVNLFGEMILCGGFMPHVSINDLNECIPLQYVGIKDNTNEGVYEGDILALVDGSIGEVKYDESIASYIFAGKLKSQRENIDWESTSLSYVRPRESKAIGNIFENPELLK